MIEYIGILFTLISVYLSRNSNRYCWVFGIVGVIMYFMIFFKIHDYLNMFLQVVFFIQCVYGWFHWSKTNISPSYLQYKAENLIIVPLFIFLFSLSRVIASRDPFLDSITTTLSIYATYLLSRKKIEGWVYWVVSDLFLVMLFFKNDMYPSMVTYFIFLLLSISGFLKWRKDIKEA